MTFREDRSVMGPNRHARGPMLRLVVLLAGVVGFLGPARAEVSVGPEYTFPGGDHRSCDICVHPATGRPHVAWETNDGHLKYSFRTGSRWSTPEAIPGAVNVGAVHADFRNGAVTMAIDSAGRVHVVYVTLGPRGGLYHVHQKTPGGSWSAPVPIHHAPREELTWVQMAGDRRGRLFVSFEKGYRACRCEYDGSAWSDVTPLVGLTSHVHHVTVGPDDLPRILFKAKRGDRYEAYLATKRPGGWRVSRVTDEGGGVDCPAGAVDAANRLHVIWAKCAEKGHDAVLKYQTYAGTPMSGRVIAKSNAHSFCRLLFDDGAALYAFMPRRYPPKFIVQEEEGRRWSSPIPLGTGRQGYWFFEAAAHGNEVHLVYSNGYRVDGLKTVTYRKITRHQAPSREPWGASGGSASVFPRQLIGVKR